jgi:uncharacterized Zn finger protein
MNRNSYENGIALAGTRRIHKVRGKDVWYVQSQVDDKRFYRVSFGTCECPDFEYRGGPCKHQLAAMEYEARRYASG